jgi:predicted histidine transporter YuiF (NhaC family)
MPECIGIVYILVAVAFLIRATNDWKVARTHPPDWLDATTMGMGLIYCLLPLIFGLIFRRTLKREMDRNLMSLRTLKLCSFRIAILLFFVYMGMTISPTGK